MGVSCKRAVGIDDPAIDEVVGQSRCQLERGRIAGRLGVAGQTHHLLGGVPGEISLPEPAIDPLPVDPDVHRVGAGIPVPDGDLAQALDQAVELGFDIGIAREQEPTHQPEEDPALAEHVGGVGRPGRFGVVEEAVVRIGPIEEEGA